MKKSNVPMRKCIGCQESKPQDQLIRIACYEGVLTVDFEGRAKGRGVYVCKCRKCMENAKKKKAIIRGFRGEVTAAAADEAMDQILQTMEVDGHGEK